MVFWYDDCGVLMNIDEFFKVSELESAGKPEEAFALLCHLSDDEHPLAVLELSMRYISTEGFVNNVVQLEPDDELARSMAIRAKILLEKHSLLGDGEASRMLAYTYLGHCGPHFVIDRELALKLLEQSYAQGQYCAANDLAVYFLYKDISKAKYWYWLAEEHGCRVVYHPDCEE